MTGRRDDTSTARAPTRVLLTKIGLDAHDRGSRVVATWLRDSGMEVIYTAPWQRIEDVIALALQEDVDIIGISSLATDHVLIPRLMGALAAAGLSDVPVVVGGIIPAPDEALLRDSGVAAVFHPGATRDAVVGALGALVARPGP